MTRKRGKTSVEHAASARLAYELGIWPDDRPAPPKTLPRKTRTTSTGPGRTTHTFLTEADHAYLAYKQLKPYSKKSAADHHPNGILTFDPSLTDEEVEELKRRFQEKAECRCGQCIEKQRSIRPKTKKSRRHNFRVTTQGMTVCINGIWADLPIADPTHRRIDLIVWPDASKGTDVYSPEFLTYQVIPGTPAVNPQPPAFHDKDRVVATILVRASATFVLTADVYPGYTSHPYPLPRFSTGCSVCA